jgi:uncharacterized protein
VRVEQITGQSEMSSNDGGEQRPDVLALAAVVLTIAVHLGIKFVSDKPSVPFIAGASMYWALFVIVRAWQDENAFRQWGFRTQDLLPAAAASAVVFCVGALAMAMIAAYQRHLDFPLHTLVLFLVYPIWGVIQQFLALGIVVSNLERTDASRRRLPLIVLGSAALFGLMHIYDWRLAAATFLFELAVIPLYLKYGNLWPLGILQGWLGALFYLWILREDLWVESLGH